MQKTGIIPNLAVRPIIIAHTHKRVSNCVDKCQYKVVEGYHNIYNLEFNVQLDAEYNIIRFEPISVKRVDV